jgi:hypothetical protein
MLQYNMLYMYVETFHLLSTAKISNFLIDSCSFQRDIFSHAFLR